MAITTKSDKESLVQQLLAAKEKGQALELQLLVKGDATNAEKVEKANRRLTARIKELLAAMMQEWAGEADALQSQFTAANADLRAKVANITKKIQTAKNVVDFIGQIDEMIALAGKLLAI